MNRYVLMLALCACNGQSTEATVENPATSEPAPPELTPAPAATLTTGEAWRFDSRPPEFVPVVGQWEAADGVLAQHATSDSDAFNLILVRAPSYRDLEVFVRLHSVSGRIDQGGGVVWRARDARNYYIARFNPLEDNFRVYTVVDGSRTQLASATVSSTEPWQTIRIVMRGDHIECFLDGAPYLDVHDDTFTGAGQIGLWTKADARTQFDDLRATSLAQEAP